MSAFWRRKVDLPAMLGPVTSHRRCASLEIAIVGDEGGLVAAGERRLDHGMAALLHVEGAAVVDQRPAPALGDREIGERGGRVERGEGLRREGQRFGARRHLADEIVEHGELEGERLVGGAGDALLEIAERHGGEAHGARHGLAVDEGGVLQQLVGMGAGGLDVVAEHVVVADLQGRYSGIAAIAAFQLDDQAAAGVAQGAQLVELRRIGRRDEAAVAGEQRQIGGERAGQAIHQLDVMAEIAAQRSPGPAGSGASCGGRSSSARNSAASASASRMAARSRGPPRPRVRRESARSRSGTRLRRSRRDSRRRSSATKAAIMSWRAAMSLGAVSGAASQAASRRAPAPVRVRSMVASSEPWRSPERLRSSSRLRRVAASISITAPCASAARGGEARQLAGLGQLDIVDERAGGGELRAGEGAEAFERLDAVERLEPAAAVLAVEARRGQRRQRRLPVAEQLEMLRLLQQAIGQQQLARLEAGERGGEIGRLRRLHEEIAGGDIEPGEAEGAAGIGERGQVIVAGAHRAASPR